MDYAKTVLFSDLDGTLFDPRGEVSPENLAAIRRYMDLGGRFAGITILINGLMGVIYVLGSKIPKKDK